MVVTLDIRINLPTQASFNQAAAALEADLRRISGLWADQTLQYARTYPAKVAGQGYRRTFKLKRDWRRTQPVIRGDVMQTSVVNTATPYRTKVHGDDHGRDQRPIHRGRWPTVRRIAERVDVRTAIEKAVRQHVGAAFVGQRILVP